MNIWILSMLLSLIAPLGIYCLVKTRQPCQLPLLAWLVIILVTGLIIAVLIGNNKKKKG